MATTKYEKGNVVTLKSGGPRMTVSVACKKDLPDGTPLANGTDPDKQVLCVWFVGDELKSLWFDRELINVADT